MKQEHGPYPGHTRGFSLPELLVAILIAALTMTALVSSTAGQSRAFARFETHLAASQDVRLALAVISRDLRQAGFDACGRVLEPIAAASAARIVLQRDDDEDGAVDASSQERITYLFESASGTLSRVVGRQSMPLVTSLPTDGFRLAYVDGRGVPIRPDGTDLDAAERGAIRGVDITLLTRDSAGTPLGGIVTRMAVRNRPWAATAEGR